MTDAEDLASVRERLAELRERNEAARREIADAKILMTVCAEARKRGIHDITAAAKLVPRDLLVYDEDGAPLNVQECLDEVLERHPILVDGEAAERARWRREAAEHEPPFDAKHDLRVSLARKSWGGTLITPARTPWG